MRERYRETIKHLRHKLSTVSEEEKIHYKMALEGLEALIGSPTLNLNVSYWTSKDGRANEFRDMTTLHIKNSIKMLKNNYDCDYLESTKTYKGLVNELAKRL